MMDYRLSAREQQFVNELPRPGRSIQGNLHHLCLIMGVVVFVISSLLTLRNLNDWTALWIMVPGSAASIVLFLGYIFWEWHARRNELFSSILMKLSGSERIP